MIDPIKRTNDFRVNIRVNDIKIILDRKYNAVETW